MTEVWGKSPTARDAVAGTFRDLEARPDAPRDRHRLENRAVLAEIAADAGLSQIRVVAWRDLDDPEAGGSELHAHRIAGLWADAGLEVTVRTSAVSNAPVSIERDGYRAVRRHGRYGVFPGAALEGLFARPRRGEGLVEIWNGMPFFSPLWWRGPRVVFLHHVHAEMWRMALPPRLARAGEVIEQSIAPALYRRARVVTLSSSSRAEIIELLGLAPERLSVAAPGVSSRFSPSGPKHPRPLVAAVGRLVPVKRFDRLIESFVAAKARCPEFEAVIVGEGYERARLEALVASHDAGSWLSLPGHLEPDELLALYRRAWVVASTSLREGWGMTLTEAAACGTPSIASDIAGHRDAVLDGQTGLLVADSAGTEGFAAALGALVEDPSLRARLGRGAHERARFFTWDATARATLQALADEALRRSGDGRAR